MIYGPEAELQRISAKYFKTLCDISEELAKLPYPREQQVVELHLPFHRLEFKPHQRVKCKECGK